MEYPALVRMGTLYPFLDVLRRAGCPIDRHLENCRLLRQVNECDPESYIPLANALCFLERSSRSEGMEDLGFLAGAQTRIHDLGEYGRLVLSEPTVLQALRRAHRASRNYNTSLREWTISEGSNLRLCRAFRLTSPVGLSHADHFAQLLTLDPHAYRALQAYYPRYGVWYPVQHYTMFLAERTPQLQSLIVRPIEATVTYHDNCCVGRRCGSSRDGSPRCRAMRELSCRCVGVVAPSGRRPVSGCQTLLSSGSGSRRRCADSTCLRPNRLLSVSTSRAISCREADSPAENKSIWR